MLAVTKMFGFCCTCKPSAHTLRRVFLNMTILCQAMTYITECCERFEALVLLLLQLDVKNMFYKRDRSCAGMMTDHLRIYIAK
jgi:hypothetical protein